MSLIERAVARLGGDPPVFPQTVVEAEPLADEIGVGSASTIEKLMERKAPAPAVVATPERPKDEPPRPDALGVHLRLDSLRRRGFVVPDEQMTKTGEEFRVIKRPLIANAFGMGAAPVKNGRRVMVTSAFPGEGKSFCSINLALSIAAERDHKVLLVDADVARPSIPRELGFQAGAGLMDCVLEPDKFDVRKLILQTDIEKLSVLPSGRRHEHATELLASKGMQGFLDMLSASYPDSLILFDSPPVLMTTESRVLATYMGQIVLVVEAGKTPKSAVTDAISTIEGTSDVIGILLNKSSGSNTGGYGYYGYGYGVAKPSAGG